MTAFERAENIVSQWVGHKVSVNGQCDDIVAAIEAAVAAERERCAKLAESILPHPVNADVSPMDRVERWRFEHTRKTIAAAIREPKRG